MAATPAQGLRRHKCPQTLKASGEFDLTDLAVDDSAWLNIL